MLFRSKEAMRHAVKDMQSMRDTLMAEDEENYDIYMENGGYMQQGASDAVVSVNPNVNLSYANDYNEQDDNIVERDSTTYNLANDIMRMQLGSR